MVGVKAIGKIIFVKFFFHRIDTTDSGHILGRADHLNDVPFPERNLKRANCAIMKLLLHMAMYIGANNNLQVRCFYEIKEKILCTYIS